jgi:competence protein ComEC
VAPALFAFVAGDAWLQQFARLPDPKSLTLVLIGTLALAGVSAVACRLLRAPMTRVSWVCRLRIPAAAFAIGFAIAGLHAHIPLSDSLAFEDEGRELRVRGVVASLPAIQESGARFNFAIDAVVDSNVRVPKLVSLSWYGADPPPVPAQRWELSVRLRRPQATLNPGGFDAEAWLLEQGVRALGTVRTGAKVAPPVLLEERAWAFGPLVDRVRARLRDRLQALTRGERYASVVVALVMGDQGPISEDDWALFNRTGISHLISISGLHITMIAGLVAWWSGAVWRRSHFLLRHASLPVVRSIAAIAGGLAYCLLAGWGVPAQRTLLMLSVVAIALCLRARIASTGVLGLAAALVSLWDPWAVLEAGFWLSFGAVSCIFLVADGRLPPEKGWRSALREAVTLQSAITVGQVPLTLAIFGQVSLVAPVANAIAIPLVSYLVAPLALVGAAFSACGHACEPIAKALLAASSWLFARLATVLEWMTTPAWSWFALAMPPIETIGIAMFGCVWLLAPYGWPLRWLGLCAFLPMLCWPVSRPASGEFWVTALDVGQGMSLIVESENRVVVFDTGPRYSPDADAAGRVLVPYLRARGVHKVDLLIVSHQDIDHAGGARTLLRSFPVDALWTSVDADNPLIGGAHDVERCEAGQHQVLGEFELEVLSPPASLYDAPHASTNAKSCVVSVRVGPHAVLLTGDVPSRQEAQMARVHPHWPVDLLVAPHHGSHTSSSEALIDATAPRWVSMQLGYRNRFGHPHPEVMERYRTHGIEIVRSDEAGAARWRFAAGSGAPTIVERLRTDHPRYWYNHPETPALRQAGE